MRNSNEPINGDLLKTPGSETTFQPQDAADMLSKRSMPAVERQHFVKALTIEGAKILQGIALEAAQAKGADFYGWKNSPEVKDRELTIDGKLATLEAGQGRWKEKLDCAYAERFLLTVAYITAAVEKGVEVCLLQKQEEPGLPFDAKGWVLVSIGTYPMFHIAPWDLPMTKLEQEGLVNLVVKGSEEDQRHAWKNTDKLQEFGLLFSWLNN